MADSWTIKEEGKNGTVEVTGDVVIRTRKKTLGRDDRQVIPASSISHVEHDRKRLGADILTVYVGSRSFEWKCSHAEQLASAILTAKGVTGA